MRWWYVGVLTFVCSLPAVQATESGDQAALSPVQLLEKAEGLVGARAEDAAMVIFRDLATRRAENPAVAGRAQLRIGECLLLNYHRPNEAEPELRKVVVDFSDQTESVNWAKVRLLHVCMLQKRWTEIPAIIEAIQADAKVGKATADQVTWALKYVPGSVGPSSIMAQVSTQSASTEDAALSSVQLLEKAEGMIRARAGDTALVVLQAAVRRQSSDPLSAAKAQLRIGEYLLTSYRRSTEAEAEFRKVLSGFGGYAEQANWARVGLCRVFAQQERWDEAAKLLGEIEADAQSGKVLMGQAVWVTFIRGCMEESMWKAAEQKSASDEALNRRLAAMSAYIRVLDSGKLSSCESEALKRLVDLLAEPHRYVQEEQNRNPAHLRQAKVYVAMLLNGIAEDAVPAAEQVGEDSIFRRRSATLLRLARRAEQMKSPDEAIAWYRLVLADANRSPEQEREANETVGRLLVKRGQSRETEQWWSYLVDPSSHEDPAAKLVMSQFGFSPERKDGSSAGLTDRQVALGRLYCSQKRWPEAQERFAQALLVATTDRERGLALMGLAVCKRWRENKDAALQPAQEAADAWLRWLAATTSDGEAHNAIEMAADSLTKVGHVDRAIALLTQLVSSLSPEQQPARACFARYRLVLEYQGQQRPAEAKALAQETLSLFLDKPFAQGHDWLCGNLMIRVAYMLAREGDFQSAFQMIDDLERRWPGQFGGRAKFHRASLSKLQASPLPAR